MRLRTRTLADLAYSRNSHTRVRVLVRTRVRESVVGWLAFQMEVWVAKRIKRGEEGKSSDSKGVWQRVTRTQERRGGRGEEPLLFL